MPDYSDLLQLAIDVAVEAGALLRAEFLRPGGPRGGAGHAEADDAAERLIRERLLAATPDWAFRGEESGLSRPEGWPRVDEPAHIWLVDPNDGTSDYLAGVRGSAVAIALLRDEIPVLGVVYAFAAPDNEGDLLAWAENCGPIRRNGELIEPRQWPASLTPGTVALVTHKADRNAAASIGLAALGRYRGLPSIAYRLALAAAGDGDVAVSTNGPVGWDYAAGHALLRGAGGAFVDGAGRAITYTVDGHSYGGGTCIGGAPGPVPALVERLRAARWSSDGDSARFRLYPGGRGMSVADDGLLRRAQGCLLGQLAGDALGSMVEFKPASAIRRLYADGLGRIGLSPVWNTLAGQPTDDSELALMLARALVAAGRYDDEQVAAAYGYWYASEPFDCGTTTSIGAEGIRAAQARGTSLAAGAREAASRGSESNGALMRQSPLAIWGHALAPEQLDALVRRDTTLTHPNRVCQDASAAFVVALAAVIRDGLDAASAYEQARDWDRRHGASEAVTRALEDARRRRPDYERSMGHVPIALQNAFYQALNADSFAEGVAATAMAGGDTDTNAAIAGALLGAIHGARAVPEQWRQALLTCRPHAADPGAHHPRPVDFWPVDALVLAEQLIVSGVFAAREERGT